MTRRSFRRDERALGIGIVLFFAMITIGALLFVLMNPVVTNLESMMLEQTDAQTAENAIAERATIFGGILWFVLFAAGLFILARAAAESRGP
jgi:hypothetical protein